MNVPHVRTHPVNVGVEDTTSVQGSVVHGKHIHHGLYSSQCVTGS